MDVTELSLEERTELKQRHCCNVLYADEDVSYGELACIDDLVTDDEIFEAYRDTMFTEDDFFCNQREL